MFKRTTLLCLLFLLTTACGGGGGSPAPGGTPDPDPDPTPDEVAIAMLEDCSVGAVDGLETAFEVMQNILTAASGVIVTNVSPMGETLDFQIDLNNDQAPDASVSMRFEDDMGEPASLGLTEQEVDDVLMNGPSELLPFFAALDGTTMILTMNVAGTANTSGTLEVLFTSGLPDTASGDLEVTDDMCATTLMFTDQSFADLITPVPSLTLAAAIMKSPDTLAGSMVLNGTNTASATMALNGGTPAAYNINLTTGDTTPAP